MADFGRLQHHTIDYLVVLFLMTVSLGLGTAIYYSAGEDLVGMSWLRNFAPPLDQFFSYAATVLPDILTTKASQNHIPDFCWSYAIAVIFIRIWVNQLKKILAYLLSVVVACSYELAQLFDFMPGVFDPIDVMVSAFAGLSACYLVVQIQAVKFTISNNK